MRYINRRGAVAAAVMAMVGTIAVPTAVDAHGRWRKTVTVQEGESIQAAIDDARRGTRIIVKGHHVENVWIAKDGIQLIGRGGASMELPADPTPNPCQGQNPETGETFDAVVCVFPEPGEFPAADEDRLRNVTVKNLSVTGSTSDAIAALFVDGLQIRGNTVTDPGCDAIFALGVSDFDLSNNEASGSQNCGGIRAVGSSDGRIRDNVSTDHAFAGLEAADSTNVEIKRNTVTGNCIGIVTQDTEDPFGIPNTDITVTRNTVNGNNTICYPFDPPGSFTTPVGAAGILVGGGSDIVVKNNTANDNVSDEFSITASGIFVTDLPGADPTGPPVYIPENVTIQGNTATGNSSAAGPVDLFMPTTGTVAVKNNECGTSVPDPGWCGGTPLAARFIEGGALAGSANGMSFGPDGTLWVANVFGLSITQIDPESGAIISQLTLEDGVVFPDDLIVASNGDIYWTNIGAGVVFKTTPGGASVPLAEVPSANPITLSEDETRLFAAGCYGAPPANNNFVEIDPINGGVINTLRSDVPGCASNGMSWNDGFLYSPQPFEDRILRIDPDTGDITTVTENWPTPIGTAFDSQGNLYSLAQGVGEVVRIDIDNPDTQNNRTVIAEIPFAWADNIAIDDNDRIYISSATDSSVSEVLPDGSLRTVVAGDFQLAGGMNVIDDIVYVTHPSGVVSYDLASGAQLGHYRTPAGVGDLPFVLSSSVWDDELVLMSPLDGSVLRWDPVANVELARTVLPGPVDAEALGDELLVTTLAGDIFRLDESLAVVEVVANVPGVTGIVVKGKDAWVADSINGTVLQIIDKGAAMSTPEVAFDGLAGPEGLDIEGNKLYVVEGATGTVTKIQMKSGKRTTIADGLVFQPPLFFPFGLFNNVTVDHGDVYVNDEVQNVIYKF